MATLHWPSQSRVLIGLAKLPAHRLRMNLSDLLIHRGLLQPLHLRCRQCWVVLDGAGGSRLPRLLFWSLRRLGEMLGRNWTYIIILYYKYIYIYHDSPNCWLYTVESPALLGFACFVSVHIGLTYSWLWTQHESLSSCPFTRVRMQMSAAFQIWYVAILSGYSSSHACWYYVMYLYVLFVLPQFRQ